MRIKLFIKQLKPDQVIPINYQYALSSFIYNTIATGDSQFSKWLHDVGFLKNSKPFKFFNFSPLIIPKFELFSDRLKILSDNIELYISTISNKSIESFIIGIFKNQELKIYDSKSEALFIIKYAEQVPSPDFSDYEILKCLSPLVVSKSIEYNGNISEKYLSPTDADFFQILKKNIEEKYMTYCLHFGVKLSTSTIENIDLKSAAKSQLITIKQGSKYETKVKGYKFTFGIKGNPEMIKLCYEVGFGKLCSLGFGFVNKIN